MKKSRKIWIGVGAFIMTGSADGAPSADAQQIYQTGAATKHIVGRVADRSRMDVLAQAAATFGQGGEAGEAGEGGEAGIDAQAAASDPVEYGVALQVIAAHYHAGLAAYRAKEHEAGAQLFAHGLSEVYAEMEDVFKAKGVAGLDTAMQGAIDAAVAGKPFEDVRRQVRKVLAALRAAEKRAPKSDLSQNAVKAKIVAAMIERAAAQYAVVQKDDNLEAYLDGLGFAIAARRRAQDVLPWIRKNDVRKEKAVRQALSELRRAYPGAARPAAFAVGEAELLAAASAAQLAVSGLR